MVEAAKASKWPRQRSATILKARMETSTNGQLCFLTNMKRLLGLSKHKTLNVGSSSPANTARKTTTLAWQGMNRRSIRWSHRIRLIALRSTTSTASTSNSRRWAGLNSNNRVKSMEVKSMCSTKSCLRLRNKWNQLRKPWLWPYKTKVFARCDRKRSRPIRCDTNGARAVTKATKSRSSRQERRLMRRKGASTRDLQPLALWAPTTNDSCKISRSERRRLTHEARMLQKL